MPSKAALAFVLLCASLACFGGGERHERRAPRAPALEISGSVTATKYAPVYAGSNYGNISYIVTTTASADARNCFVKVKWLDESGMQVSFTYAANRADIPAGTSEMTSQHYVHRDIAALVAKSLVEYSNCKPTAR